MSKAFSFIEVMAATVILSISLVILMESQGMSLNLVGRARMLDYGTTLATAKMTELTQIAEVKGVTTLKEEDSGEFDQEKHPGYRWRSWINKVPAPNFAEMMGQAGGKDENRDEGLAKILAGITKSWSDSIRELHVEVNWDEGKGTKSVELTTHLISPQAMTQIQGLISGLGGGPSKEPPKTPTGVPTP